MNAASLVEDVSIGVRYCHPMGWFTSRHEMSETGVTEPTTRIKICCIRDLGEALLAAAHGADAIGLVSAMPSGPGILDEEAIGRIARAAPPHTLTVLLTSRRDTDSILDQHRRLATGALQLVDRVTPQVRRSLRQTLPAIAIIQVVHVIDTSSVDEALEAAESADFLLLDSGNPSAAVKQLGGTGRVHDWRLSRRIRELAPVPVFLAGGLRPDNVGEAVRAVRPFGVDVCSGLRPAAALDAGLLSRFASAVRRADAEWAQTSAPS